MESKYYLTICYLSKAVAKNFFRFIGLQGSVRETDVIVYNRIPKTGSTSLMGVAYALCSKNGFNVIHINTTKNSHILSPADQVGFCGRRFHPYP